jgi:hypothetical protein
MNIRRIVTQQVAEEKPSQEDILQTSPGVKQILDRVSHISTQKSGHILLTQEEDGFKILVAASNIAMIRQETGYSEILLYVGSDSGPGWICVQEDINTIRGLMNSPEQEPAPEM